MSGSTFLLTRSKTNINKSKSQRRNLHEVQIKNHYRSCFDCTCTIGASTLYALKSDDWRLYAMLVTKDHAAE